jgi:pyroglutamyl-peptidase
LITGFDKFGKNKINPTELMVAALPEQITHKGGRIALPTAVLPTCCQGAWRLLQEKISKDEPDVLILTGLAQGRKVITVERFALNIRDYRIADNGGHEWDGDPIHKHGPEAIRNRLPLKKLTRQLEKAGFPCDISNHAGTFVCNETYYRALAYQNEHPEPIVLFVHLPLPDDYAKSVESSKTKLKLRKLKTQKQQIDFMGAAVLEMAKFCLDLGSRIR